MLYRIPIHIFIYIFHIHILIYIFYTHKENMHIGIRIWNMYGICVYVYGICVEYVYRNMYMEFV